MVTDKRIFWKIFVTLTLLGIAYWFLFDFLRWDMFDSPGFAGAARLLFGLEGGYDPQSRLTKPLVLIFPGLLEYVWGLDVRYGFLIQGVISFYGSGFLMYAIVHKLTRSEEIAFTGMLAYVMCQPFAIFTLMILADGPGWMLGLLIIYLALDTREKERFSYRRLILLASISALGLLVKENVIFGFIFLIFFLVFSNLSRKELFFRLLVAAGTFLLVFVFSQWLTAYLFADTIIDRVQLLRDTEGFVFYNRNNIPQVFRIIDFYWILFGVGIIGMARWLREYQLQREVKAFLLSVGVSLLLMPVYPVVEDRIMFMVAPGLILFVTMSRHLLGRYALPLVILGGILNIAVAWLIYMHDTSGLLMWAALFYLVVVSSAALYNQRTTCK